MASILTNNGAMVALQTMRNINKSMDTTQSQISTGLKVGSAKDNAATWAISKVMESDVAGFKSIKENLALGSSTVNVARNAAETTTKLLTEIKEKVVQAQEENVDRAKIQEDISQLRDQITSVVRSAQFNGLNLVDGSSTDAVRILASLDRDASGKVTDRPIEIGRQSLSVTGSIAVQEMGDEDLGAGAEDFFSAAGVDVQTGDLSTGTFDDTTSAAVASGADLDIEIGQVTEGTSFRIVLNDLNVNVVGGGSTLGTREFNYVASATDGVGDVARNLVDQMNAFFGAATNAADAYTAAFDGGTITLTHNNGDDALLVGLGVSGGGKAGPAAGTNGLSALQGMDVVNDATGALGMIDGLINQSIEAASAFGSAQKRIEIQSDFVGNLMDSMKSGIGSLVDADMEETSARLQALQVQQQLGIQALTIANQQPQNILALFR